MSFFMAKLIGLKADRDKKEIGTPNRSTGRTPVPRGYRLNPGARYPYTPSRAAGAAVAVLSQGR
jgi:hypothetical protein